MTPSESESGSEIPPFRPIGDYRLLTALTPEHLHYQAQQLEESGWSPLGSRAYIRRDNPGCRPVFIQPMVIYLDGQSGPGLEKAVL